MSPERGTTGTESFIACTSVVWYVSHETARQCKLMSRRLAWAALGHLLRHRTSRPGHTTATPLWRRRWDCSLRVKRWYVFQEVSAVDELTFLDSRHLDGSSTTPLLGRAHCFTRVHTGEHMLSDRTLTAVK